ncbi:RNA-binding protein [Arthrobacter agilis]|uniref:Jag family protein n=1 Tax=Arthrobacter agilis TaxID=37921 RepID=UPI000B355D86|nr:R3H domain-containing nucleic acid-binding protein [Arthrobacter agilis]OUM42298.1 RNA-binding protein [Arthrobacter agilis]PPB45640.1 RNA-binding protein [Arthrobacter agilis]TPV26378.1 RNA-binding protein [Arthrobacter agilis]VDR33732.1 R3H domain [Arthrobacter agilis]
MSVENEELTPDSDETTSETAEPAESPVGSKSARLDEEGDVAADYLEELLDIADIDGDIDIEVRSGRTYISIVSEDSSGADLGVLVGSDGEVLEALQELTRLSVLTATDARSRLVLDVDGYRDRRGRELSAIAKDAVEKVRETAEDVALAPMSAYERKIVHDVVADLGFVSESEGEGQSRHIVVSPSDD